GALLRSVDSGRTWQRIASGATKTVRAVSVTSTGTFFAVGDDGTIIRSTDAGVHWEPISSGTSAALRGIHFIDEKRGVIVGGDDRRWRAERVLLRTTDGGASWASVEAPAKLRLYAAAGVGETVVAVGDSGVLLRSTDAG